MFNFADFIEDGNIFSFVLLEKNKIIMDPITIPVWEKVALQVNKYGV